MGVSPVNSHLRNSGRLERRKARTRATILEAASQLFREQGFERTSIAQIAEAADTGVGTLYGYFANKDEILREVLRHHGEEEIASFLAAITESTLHIDRLCLALGAFARWVRDNRTLLMSAFEASARSREPDDSAAVSIAKSLVTMIKEGIAAGEIRPIPPVITAKALISTYSMAMLGAGQWRGDEDEPRTIDDLEAMVRGMLTS